MMLLEYIKELFFTDIELGNLVLPMNLLDILLKLILPSIIIMILYKVIMRGIKRAIEKSKLEEQGRVNLYKWLKFSFRFIVFIAILLIVINLLGAQISLYLSAFGTVLTKPFISGISISTIILIIPILYLAQISGRWSQKLTESTISTYFSFNTGTRQTIVFVIKNVVMVLVVLFGLTVIGIDLTLLLGLFGVIGIGIGFGLQDLVKNFFAGFVILTTKPVKVGDHITVEGTEGEIVDIRFLQSVVSTITHESIIIPNSLLIDNPVHNYSYDDKSIIIKNSVQVSYDTDLDKALAILEKVAEESPYRLKGEEISTRVVSFDDSGITLCVVSWIRDSGSKYVAQSHINLEIWRAFKVENVDIPFPQMDLKIKR